jgi:phosphoheptose isomerase
VEARRWHIYTFKIKKKMANIDFENIEEKFEQTLQTEEWKEFVKDFNESDDIYIVANGGLWAVGNHAADDCTRLFAKAGIKKHISNLESQCLITSIANDYGYNNLFLNWLSLAKETGKMDGKKPMVVALSCSGNSKNVISCLHWAEQNGYKSALISGQNSQVIPEGINEVVLGCKYFHTVEVLTLILFYELIHACGAACPSIKDEVVRKGAAESIDRKPIK